MRAGHHVRARGPRRPPRPDRPGEPAGQRRRHPRRGPRPGRRRAPRTNARPAASRWRRCTGCPSPTRTPTSPRASAPRSARRCWPTTSRPRTSSSSSGSSRPGRSPSARPTCPEFAAGSHTVNPVFGATRNPYDRTRSAGGSSGGAAAAVACGMVPIADGSDMGGSLRNPAAFCNVVGLRPSPGRVPTYPVPMAWSTLSVQGPIARSVGDVALALSALAGPDPRSPIAIPEPASVFAAPLERDLRGLRVAWSPDLRRGPAGRAGPCSDALAPVPAVFERLGAVVEEACPDLHSAEEVFRTLRAWHFAQAYGPLAERAPGAAQRQHRLERRAGPPPRRRRPRPRRGPAHRAVPPRPRVLRALRRPDPAGHPGAAVRRPRSTTRPRSPGWRWRPTWTGCGRATGSPRPAPRPCLSPRRSPPDGLPVGLQIVGPHRGDLGVLQIGHAFEQATGVGRRRPVRSAG